MGIWLLALSLYLSTPERYVEQHVDTISVVHVRDGAELIFFYDFVQGEWSCLDHRWLAGDMLVGRQGERWTLAWHDDGDSCWRLMIADRWYETWTDESPLAGQHNRPWFVRLLAPGLSQGENP